MSKISKIKVNNEVYDIQDVNVGELENLTTETKNNLVDAINEVANSSSVDLSDYVTKDELKNKVDKVEGKSLIDDTEIERLANVTNYDDTEMKNILNSKANIGDIPTKISQLTNDSNFVNNEITGSLENLSTEAKDNLVNAINEVANNSGGSDTHLYKIHTSDTHFLNSTNSFTNKKELGEIITDAYSKGYKYILLDVTYGAETSNNENILFTTLTKNLQLKPTNINFKVLRIGGNRYMQTSLFMFSTYQLQVGLSWNGDVCTVGSATMYYSSSNLLATDNNAAFTPTRDYQPTTKKYVDDAIKNAVTNVLEADY